MSQSAARREREFDVVLWGATGFTGRLVAAYLAERAGSEALRWALAARNGERLVELREGLGPAAAAVPLIVADSHDRASLAALAQRTRVVVTTVGPYALYGSELVAACVEAGTDYCDLAGEVQWMRRMIDAHQARAEATGARIVHCCGFDSIPSDLGVHFLQRAAREQFGEPCHRVGLRVRAARGGFSGGTVASMLNLIAEGRRDREVARILRNPYALNPPDSRDGPRQASHGRPSFDRDVDSWLAPFVMAAINTRVVHRTNALLGFPYGREFRYDEAILTGRGLPGRTRAMAIAAGLGAFTVAAGIGPARAILRRTVLPAPGDGPDEAAREAGFFNLLLVGRVPPDQLLRARVTGDRDPGYGSTAKMIGETAICLASDAACDATAGGFWTPAAALGDALVARLQAHAGLTFTIVGS